MDPNITYIEMLDESADPLDASSAIIRVQYTGFCGSDAGIWFRSSFKDMIHSSLKAEGKTTRVIGHEVFGVVEEVGSVSEARYGIEKGQLVSAESHKRLYLIRSHCRREGGLLRSAPAAVSTP